MGFAFMPHIGGIDLDDLEFEAVDSPYVDYDCYDPNKGMYIVFTVSLHENQWDGLGAAVFMDGEVVETFARDGIQIRIGVDSSGNSRFVGGDYRIALRIKTKREG